jgi:hypothetical protein
VAALGCRESVSTDPDRPEPVSANKTSFKGWELYCWRRDREWAFALLIGTNRIKSDAEIEQARVGLDAVLAELSNLAKGQTVVLGHNRARNQLPPQRIRRAILERCRTRGLETLLWRG